MKTEPEISPETRSMLQATAIVEMLTGLGAEASEERVAYYLRLLGQFPPFLLREACDAAVLEDTTGFPQAPAPSRNTRGESPAAADPQNAPERNPSAAPPNARRSWSGSPRSRTRRRYSTRDPIGRKQSSESWTRRRRGWRCRRSARLGGPPTA